MKNLQEGSNSFFTWGISPRGLDHRANPKSSLVTCEGKGEKCM